MANKQQTKTAVFITKMKDSDVVIYIQPRANARETSFGYQQPHSQPCLAGRHSQLLTQHRDIGSPLPLLWWEDLLMSLWPLTSTAHTLKFVFPVLRFKLLQWSSWHASIRTLLHTMMKTMGQVSQSCSNLVTLLSPLNPAPHSQGAPAFLSHACSLLTCSQLEMA